MTRFHRGRNPGLGVNHLSKGAEQEKAVWSPVQSLPEDSLVVGKEGSVGRGDGQGAGSRGAADSRAGGEAHI